MATNTDVSALYSIWIGVLRQREDELGCRAPDGASAEELEDVLHTLENLTTEPNSLTPAELNGLMNKIELVMDAWLFPEEDPIAPHVRQVLTEIHNDLGELLDTSVPGVRQERKHYEDLRLLQWSTRRAVAIQERKQPGSSERFSFKLFLGTLLGSGLHRIGTALKWLGKLLDTKRPT